MRSAIEAWRRASMHPAIRPFTDCRIVLQWRIAGRPIPPPPPVKQSIVKEYQRRFGPRTLIETGHVRRRDDRRRPRSLRSPSCRSSWIATGTRVLSPASAPAARDAAAGRQRRRGCRKCSRRWPAPALFWLDAHYSGPITARGVLDTPIVQELAAIRAHPVAGHVVLIDDMRDFTGADGYPTVDGARRLDPRRRIPAAIVEVRDDVLRWHGPR